MSKADDELLLEIRTRFQEATDLWRPIREEGKTDIRYVAGDPWDEDEREKREALKRPCLSLDELNQYTNQLINDARSHPRGIQVAPRGFGANDKTASLRADKLREIEYRSGAQTVYTTMFQNTVERSYGFLRINVKWEPGQWTQNLWLEEIVNPDLVTPDPWMLRQTGADMRYCFVHELRDEADFKAGGEFAGAQITSFDSDFQKVAPTWIRGNKIQVAEYWKVKTTKRILLGVVNPQNPSGPLLGIWKDTVPEDELPKMAQVIKREREEDAPSVCRYLTNGLEILDTTEWRGTRIPIISCLGKVLYVDDGGGAERKILSLVRLGRDPVMLYCYYRTQQAEIAGMIPKVPIMGYKGQFRGLEYNYQKAPHEPLAFLEAYATTEETGDTILPLPTRLPYAPGEQLQSLELCAEGARRAIQASMGAYALPTTAQRHNEKSGVALQEIKENTQIGNFHFLDHYNDSIRETGIVANELLGPVHNQSGPIVVRTLDGKTEERPVEADAFQIGEHDITISTGPSLDSQRDEANQLADALISNDAVLQIIGPQRAVKLLALAVKLRNPGPSGDLMSAVIDPQNEKDRDALMMGQKLQEAVAQIQQLTQAATVMKQALDAKAIETQGKMRIEAMKEQAESERAALDRETKLAVAELQAKVERLTLFMEERARLGAQAHETALSAASAGHDELIAQLPPPMDPNAQVPPAL